MWLTWPWAPVWLLDLKGSQTGLHLGGEAGPGRGRAPIRHRFRLNAQTGPLVFMAWNGSWNEWPRISSAISATGVVRRAVCAGSEAEANSRASRNA
jgi:hypothetical protein